MALRIVEESGQPFDEYGRISIAFCVESRLRVEIVSNGLGGLRLIEEKVEPPYVKDYDRIPGERPADWAGRWDTSRWGVFAAFHGTERVGGAVVVRDTPGIHPPEDGPESAVLLDLRVAPEHRGRGIGSALLRWSAEWARQQGCRSLKIETQNINVAACQFYARSGCRLGAISTCAYPDFPEEAQLLWYLDLVTP